MTVTRRRLLGALAAGSAGGLTGRGAAALLGDRERTNNALTAGLVDIVVEYWQDIGTDGPDLSAPDGVGDGALDVRVEFGDGETASRDLFRISLPQDRGGVNNPTSVWLGADCPAGSTLAELLVVTLSYSDGDGEAGPTIASGPLREVASDLRAGVRLDGGRTTDTDGCLTDELFVLAEYELPDSVGTETVSLPLTVAGLQCRNTPASLNPFGEPTLDPCPPGYSCDCCWLAGKVEVETPLEAGVTYPFDEGLADYGVAVTDVDGGAGVAFELVASGDAPPLPLCAVDIKGGRGYALYSRPDGGTVGFDTTVLDGADDGLIYAPANDDSGGNYDISHILVGVCVPRQAEGSCPDALVERVPSGGGRP